MGCEDIDGKQIQKRAWNDNGCRNTRRSDSASIMQMFLKDDSRMAKREGLAPCCILVANFSWCPQGSIAFYSKTFSYILLWNWCHQVWPSRRAKCTYVSKYRLTWSIVSTSYSKGSVVSLDIFGCWITNLIGFRSESYGIHEGHHFCWVVDHRFPILEMSEYWRSRRIALMRMVISTSFMAIENSLGKTGPYKLWRALTGLRRTSFHCQAASFFPPLSSSNFLSFTQPAGI